MDPAPEFTLATRKKIPVLSWSVERNEKPFLFHQLKLQSDHGGFQVHLNAVINF